MTEAVNPLKCITALTAVKTLCSITAAATPASHASINVERFVFKGIDITDVVFELLGPNGLGELELEIEEDIQDGFGLDIEDFME